MPTYGVIHFACHYEWDFIEFDTQEEAKVKFDAYPEFERVLLVEILERK